MFSVTRVVTVYQHLREFLTAPPRQMQTCIYSFDRKINVICMYL